MTTSDANHLGHNRARNARLREDTPRAREEQLLEDEAAALAQTKHELCLLTQYVVDGFIFYSTKSLDFPP